jgi:hypothetical protein
VSWPTAKRWADRHRDLGAQGMQDRPSRPHRQPTRTSQPLVRKIVHLRWKRRLGPVAIASVLQMPPSTVHAVLRRCGISRLSQVDRATGEPVRRYEHERPDDLLHIDVKKLGNIPDGGGWRYVKRAQGDKNRAATPGISRSKHRGVLLWHAFVHTVVDDHSRVAYAVQADPALPATDQRQGRSLSPHDDRWLGLPPALRQRVSPPQRPASLAARVQPSAIPNAIGKATPTSRLTNLPGHYS